MSADVAPPTPRPKTTGLHRGEPRPGVEKVDPIIVADGVTRVFGGLTAVDVEHLEIPRGAITALIGPNGAGKTTLFNLLTGFDKPNAGTWSFDGTALSGIPAYKTARMGQVRTFQLTKSLGLLTVLENMLLGATHQTGERLWAGMLPFLWRRQENEIEAKARELLARFKLDTKEKDFAASLSGGQRKLLEMARALMSDPQLVMLDEPMAGVNPALTESLLDHILDLKDLGMTVLFWVVRAFLSNLLPALVQIGWLPFLTSEQSQMLVFVLVGVALMLLVIFRPQGILGNKKELTFVR